MRKRLAEKEAAPTSTPELEAKGGPRAELRGDRYVDGINTAELRGDLGGNEVDENAIYEAPGDTGMVELEAEGVGGIMGAGTGEVRESLEVGGEGGGGNGSQLEAAGKGLV